jgi:methylamine dehydrogenase accessory protein MauD
VNSIIFISVWLLWIIVLTLSLMVLYLYKRIEGSKNKRTLSKNDVGVPKGEFYPIQKFQSIQGRDINVNTADEGTVLIFTHALCDVCKRIYPILENVKKQYPKMNLVILMLASKQDALNIVNKFSLEDFPVTLIKDEELNKLGISGFPFSYLLSPQGKIIEKGLVNYKEHFDILLSHRSKSRNVS